MLSPQCVCPKVGLIAMAAEAYQLSDLLRVMERLRDPEAGCPWDLAQDFRSIVPSTLEEAYELVDAIEHADYPHIAEELGDVLFQVVFYAQLGREQGVFDFDHIVSTLVDKLLRRHPHVFAKGEVEGRVAADVSVSEVKQSWEAIKKQERSRRKLAGLLADIPLSLPALSRAQKVQKRAAQIGFDWEHIGDVILKLDEELLEFREATVQSRERQEDEIGDLLFTCVNLARHAGFDAEAALRRATAKFEDRFQAMEDEMSQRGQHIDELDLAALEVLWQEAKDRA
jgi:ATP diphosphatase